MRGLYWYDGKCIQSYIVTGGLYDATIDIASTEILKKDGGISWRLAASLPSARHCIRGVSMDDGRFIVAGDQKLFKTGK